MSLRVPQRRQLRFGVCLSAGSQVTQAGDSAGSWTPCVQRQRDDDG